MADKNATKGKKKGREGESKRAREEAPPYSSIATHPQASMRVRQAKGWGGLAGFAIAAALSLQAAVPIIQTLERALLFGTIGYLVAWSLSVFLWRQLMLAEQQAAVDEIQRRREQLSPNDSEEAPPQATPTGDPSGASSPA